MSLPNNDPEEAPFSMKVGETGEAFFVIETSEDVPEDLITSPVVSPTEVRPLHFISRCPLTTQDEPLPARAASPEPIEESLTNEPFGSTEKRRNRALPDVEPLDLNDDSAPSQPPIGVTRDNLGLIGKQSAASPSTLLGAPEPRSSLDMSRANGSNSNGENATRQHADLVSRTSDQPNPMRAEPGEDDSLPLRDHKLKDILPPRGDLDDELPRVQEGEGEGPEVVYGKDIVIDMAGYHSEQAKLDEEEHDDRPQPEHSRSSFSAEALASIREFARDLELSTSHRAPTLHTRSTDSELETIGEPETVDDLALDLDRLELESRRADRGMSEPPQTPSTPTRTFPLTPVLSRSPNGTVSPRHSVNKGTLNSERRRSESLPVTPIKKSGRLKNTEEDPFKFTLDMGDHQHEFELALPDDEALELVRDIALKRY